MQRPRDGKFYDLFSFLLNDNRASRWDISLERNNNVRGRIICEN